MKDIEMEPLEELLTKTINKFTSEEIKSEIPEAFDAYEFVTPQKLYKSLQRLGRRKRAKKFAAAYMDIISNFQ